MIFVVSSTLVDYIKISNIFYVTLLFIEEICYKSKTNQRYTAVTIIAREPEPHKMLCLVASLSPYVQQSANVSLVIHCYVFFINNNLLTVLKTTCTLTLSIFL